MKLVAAGVFYRGCRGLVANKGRVRKGGRVPGAAAQDAKRRGRSGAVAQAVQGPTVEEIRSSRNNNALNPGGGVSQITHGAAKKNRPAFGGDNGNLGQDQASCPGRKEDMG
jgi:hypothetical protein